MDFLELGLDPQEYDRFHYLVPEVGRRVGTETDYILKKTRYLWHEENWTRENCLTALDFLARVVLAKQQRNKSDSFVRQHPLDEVRFIRDSALYNHDRATVQLECLRGMRLFAVALPYVDDVWQNFGEEFVCQNFYDGKDWRFACVRKADVEVTPGVQLRPNSLTAADGGPP